MAFMSDVWYFIGSYLLILLGGFFLLNWLSAGILRRFIRVKASRGRYILCIIHTKLRSYATKGWLEGDDLVYNDNESLANKQKTPKRVTAVRDCFYRFMGVWACNIDEANNNLIKPDGSVKPGFDAIRWNNLLLRALMKPAPEDKNNLIIIIAVIVSALTLILAIIILVRIGALNSAINTLSQVKTATITGGNVV